MGAALLNTEIAIYRSDKVLREAEKELITKQEILESLVNREMPPVILAGMDIQLDCVEKGREDNIHLEHCHQGKRMVKCRAAVMKEGKGIIVHKIIAIPYFRDGRTLRLKFDENLRYKKGTGKVYDIGECTKVGLQVKCPNILVEANDCLENLTKASQVVPDSCLVEELPESRPLIINTELGTLVAQQSDTSLLAEYNDKAITNDPFILSNQKELELVYGTEEIVVPPLDVADDSLFLPNGTFEALEKIFEDGSWQSKWEDFLPLHLRQILLLTSITLQALMTIPIIFKIINLLMYWCGYEVLPKDQRRTTKRYRTRGERGEDLEMGNRGNAVGFVPRPILNENSRYSFENESPNSSRSRRSSYENRFRAQNRRAMGDD